MFDDDTQTGWPRLPRFVIRKTYRPSFPSSIAGFTLVELIVVLLIVGILAAYALPRFLGPGASEAITARDTILMAARRAQQLAMNQGTGAGVRLVTDNAAHEVRIEYTDGTLQVLRFDLPADIAVTSVTVGYDGLGNAPATTIAVAGAGSVCIETTGYARRC